MLKSICVFIVVLVLGTADSASARIFRRFCCYSRPVCCQQNCCQKTCPAPCCCHGLGPQYCLQDKWLDGDGECDDVYECLVFSADCTMYLQEVLWYGCPADNPDLPEDCDSGGCEPASLRSGTPNVPPHKMAVGDATTAWSSFEHLLKRAGKNVSDANRYMIPACKSGLVDSAGKQRPVYIMVVKVPPKSGSTSKIRGEKYFAIETGQTDVEPAKFPNKAINGPGSQLRIDFEVGVEKRSALVWLKPAP